LPFTTSGLETERAILTTTEPARLYKCGVLFNTHVGTLVSFSVTFCYLAMPSMGSGCAVLPWQCLLVLDCTVEMDSDAGRCPQPEINYSSECQALIFLVDAVRFLTRTFCNIFYVRVDALGNATFVCGVRNARERSFEEVSGETEVGRRLLAPEPRPRHTNRTPSWTSDIHRHYFAWNWTIPVVMLATVVATTAMLSSNSCKSASFLTHFTSVLWKQFVWNDTFLREANSYKRALALRNSRLLCWTVWRLS